MFRKLLCCAVGTLALAAPAAAGTAVDDAREAKGAVLAVSELALTVKPEGKPALTCLVDERSPSVAKLKVGDRLVVVCKRSGDDFVLASFRPADEKDDKDKGKVKELKVRGVVSAVSAGKLTVQNAAGDATLTCAVSERLADKVSRLAPGDKVKVVCKRRGGSAAELVSVEPDRSGSDERSELKGKGLVVEASAEVLTVKLLEHEATLTCLVPARLAEKVAKLARGDKIAGLCKRQEGSKPELVAFERLGDSEDKAKDKTADVKAKGVVVEASADSLTLKLLEHEGTLTCLVPERLAEKVAKLARGDKIAVYCKRGEGGKPELHALERTGAGDDKPKGEVVDIAGVVTAASAASLSVQAEGGRSLTCAVPDGYGEKVAALKAGDKLKMLCKRLGDTVQLHSFARLDGKPAAPPAGVKEFTARGLITALSSASITVQGEAGALTCRLPAAWADKLARFAVGDKVKLLCKGAEGSAEAAYIEKLI